MSLILLLKGVAIGIAIAAPVGPVAVLCVRRTLLQGHRAGFASGFGAVVADAIYGAIATFSVAAIAELLLRYEVGMRLVGGIFLLALGVKTFLKPPPNPGRPIAGRVMKAFMSAFFLTITNPLTILGFTAIFAGFGVVSHDMDVAASLSLILGVTVGAAIWWSSLTMISGLLRDRFAIERVTWLNKVSGGLILAFGIASVGSLLI